MPWDQLGAFVLGVVIGATYTYLWHSRLTLELALTEALTELEGGIATDKADPGIFALGGPEDRS